MPGTKAVPSAMFDHMVWGIQAVDGSLRRGEIAPGECLLLFTSLDSLHDFLAACGERDGAGLKPAVFSRGRKEFGRRAREAVRGGVVGALFDPCADGGEAPFLRFSRLTR